jgi:phospholipid transport system substrate-binding protein
MLLSTALPVSTTLGAISSEPVAPRTLIQRTTEELRAAILKEQESIEKDPNRAIALVNQIVVPHVDSLAVGKCILGRHWRKALPEQRERFIDGFRKLLLRTYAVSVGRYSDVEVAYLPIRDTDRSGSRAKVRTMIPRAGRPPINVDYGLHRTGNGWKVYDVATNGISLVATFRATVDAEVRKHGLDGLLERLEAKIEKPITPE